MALIVVTATGGMIWLGRAKPPAEDPSATDIVRTGAARGERGRIPKAATLRFGIIPEREIFEQRRRYAVLADELARRLGWTVELVTENTYEGVLADLESGRVDGAFSGSFIAVLAMDRCGVEVLCKPEIAGGVTTYRGVLVSRADGPIETVEDLGGQAVAMVRATTAGDLFPVTELARRGMLDGERRPSFRWMGTHDAAIQAVVEGRTDAAAVKDLRLAAYESGEGARPLRRLAESSAVPNNALVVRWDLDEAIKAKLKAILLDLDSDPEGRAVLEQFGAVRFVSCEAHEYEAVLEMTEGLGDRWSTLGVSGPPPRREALLGTRAVGAREGG
jgi:phosphonate transport system substrate-binding protein